MTRHHSCYLAMKRSRIEVFLRLQITMITWSTLVGALDLLIELSCILHVSTDYLLMGSEPSREEVKNDLLSIISELTTIAKKI